MSGITYVPNNLYPNPDARNALDAASTMIELVNVSVTYPGEVPALIDVQLRVLRGEFVFIVGQTGAGKSTLLKLLYREERPTQGRVVVGGQCLNDIKRSHIPQFRRKIGIVFQDFGLLPNKTVYENVAFALRVIGASVTTLRHQVPRALEMVSMAHRPDAFPHELSGGEQQRVAIARALVNEPPLLLADEPTGNLDPETSQGIVELLADISGRGTTVLVATHDAAIVDQMQRRVIAFARGRLVRDEARGNYRSGELAPAVAAPEPPAVVQTGTVQVVAIQTETIQPEAVQTGAVQ